MRGHEFANSRDQELTTGALASGTMHDVVAAQTFSYGVPGGVQAPRHARSVMSSHLHDLDPAVAADAGLIISELVTNSVRHAGVGSDQLVTVDLMLLDQRLRITVTDPGGDLEPRLIAEDLDGLGGHGLRIVEQLSAAWGVGRDAVGATQVWCDLVLDPGRGRVL
ncbi:MAG TPA: ATP-binding protein [Solirubrobacteraceae bacterium]|jgi:anti-sigma regulatory factor (Ser/Thr protein kinase)|nr:ATP-binding protein [Solirubrobacteraceae bacterium]